MSVYQVQSSTLYHKGSTLEQNGDSFDASTTDFRREILPMP